MIFQAHKGVSTENPENTMPAILAAVQQGYSIIELDVAVTRDLQFVLLHDSTINRTARHENGECITETIRISDITYQEALQYDFGIWFSRKFQGIRIPLFADVLAFAKHNGIQLKIDNKYQRFNDEQRSAFFELLRPFADIACLTCSSVEETIRVSQIFPKMHLHYDGAVTAENLEKLSAYLPKERLTVWLPHKNSGTSWVTIAFADELLASLVKQYARLGIWILSNHSQLEEARSFGADVIETNGQIKPETGAGILVDMHTHSESSHDSVCRIEDMYRSQVEKGTRIFAVTDHFDTASFAAYDVFTPIQIASDTVARLNKQHRDQCLILAGIEIGEGFWYPEPYQKAISMLDYDVVIGSVHLVQYKDLTVAYSGIDFSKLTQETIYAYLDAYFDDVLTMLDTVDFDILAHLTCPLRYICGKYGITIALSRYEGKIDRILSGIIKKGIALEVNTSSFELWNSVMPSIDILKRYYDMGGYLITLGSDAHVAENASQHFAEALEIVGEIGFKTVYYYRNRKPYPIEIERRSQ